MPGPLVAHRPWSVLLLAALLLGLLPAWPAAGAPVRAADGSVDRVCAGAPDAGFRDAASISPPFVEVVDCLAAYGITRGDAAGDYRPGDPVNRQQMALFLARFLRQATAGTTTLPVPEDPLGPFTDLDGLQPAEARTAILLLAEADITRGSGDGTRYEPARSVTRAQLASFVARTLVAAGAQLPLVPVGSFPDVDPGDVHAASIETLGALQVIRGYPDGRFGPTDRVTREQLAQFLMRAAQVLAGEDAWAGRFLDATPTDPVEPETPTEEQTPATPTPPATPAGTSIVLGIDGAERVTGSELNVTVHLLDGRGQPLVDTPVGWALLRSADWLDGSLGGPQGTGPLDLASAAVAGPGAGQGAPVTDDIGRAAVRIDTAGLAASRYLVVVWTAEVELARLADAEAWDTIAVQLTAPEVDAATLVATASLRTEAFDGVHLLLSDGEAVRAEPADEQAAYRVEGLAASRQRFLADARAGDLVEVTRDAEGRRLTLTRVDVPSAGIVEVHDGVRFVEPVSGVALSDDLDPLLAGQRYEVDGEVVGERRFRAHLSTGDHLEAEVVARAADGSPLEWRYRLTDGEVSGRVVARTGGVVTIDPNPDDVWTVGPAGLGDGLRVELAPGVDLDADAPDDTSQVDPPFVADGDGEFAVDDATTDLDGFVDAIDAVLAPHGGTGTLTYARAEGVVRAALDTVPPPPFATIRGTVVGGELRPAEPGPWQLELAVGGTRTTLPVVPEVRAVIDGLLSTSEELRSSVSFGDRVVCEGVDRDGACTQLRLARRSFEARVVFVDAEALELDLLLDSGYLLQRLDPRQRPVGIKGDPVAYALDGVSYGGELDELLATLATVDLQTHEVRVRLEDSGIEGPYRWVFTGLPEAAVTALS